MSDPDATPLATGETGAPAPALPGASSAPPPPAQFAAFVGPVTAPLLARIEALAREAERQRQRAAAAEAERDAALGRLADLEAWFAAAGAEGGGPATPRNAPGTAGPVPPFVPSVAAWRARTTRAVDLDEPGRPRWRFWGRRR